ncbi:hypothetical protein N7462_006087 [Penicillium macrosclerotiorum]|uniref:uncharacterized protein n=1 Tax=Penicillium macrosclerotiorum TaxID=303699 RepID=UPI002549B9EA|nr:uncharacterized protein N7462_006087 [Penicillium macrosclerotiorum]KAJ5682922.1 hypothetical protein N7462_006087 [Penicillium macrosclerotiorum]
MDSQQGLVFVNISHPDETREKRTQRVIRQRVMREIGKSRQKRRDAPAVTFTWQPICDPYLTPPISPSLSSYSLPVESTPRVLELLSFMNAEAEYKYRPFRKIWFSMALSDHSAFTLCMANAAMFWDEARCPESFQYVKSEEALKYYGHEGVITTILGLICHDLYVGTLDRWTYHIHGLARISRIRGGFKDLSYELQLFTCWFDVLGSAAKDSLPLLPEYPLSSKTGQQGSIDLPNRLPQPLLKELMGNSMDLDSLTAAFEQTAIVSKFVNSRSHDSGFWKLEDDIGPLQMLGSTTHKLLSVPRWDSQIVNPLSLVQEMTRLALLILLANLKLHYGMSASEMGLLQCKFFSLLQCQALDHHLLSFPTLRLWALVTAGIRLEPGPSKKLAVQRIASQMKAMRISNGSIAIEMMHDLIWINVLSSEKDTEMFISAIDKECLK